MGTLSGKINTSCAQPGSNSTKALKDGTLIKNQAEETVRATATTGRRNKMVGYFHSARWLKKTAQGLPSRDTNPQQDLQWTGAAAKCGGESGEAVLLWPEKLVQERQRCRLGLAHPWSASGDSESSLWLQSGEAVKVETLVTVFPDQ